MDSSSGLFGEDPGEAVTKVLVFIGAFISVGVFVGEGLAKDYFPVVPSKMVCRSRIPDLGKEYRFVCVDFAVLGNICVAWIVAVIAGLIFCHIGELPVFQWCLSFIGFGRREGSAPNGFILIFSENSIHSILVWVNIGDLEGSSDLIFDHAG